jgi:hypothetical protein
MCIVRMCVCVFLCVCARWQMCKRGSLTQWSFRPPLSRIPVPPGGVLDALYAVITSLVKGSSPGEVPRLGLVVLGLAACVRSASASVAQVRRSREGGKA